MNKKNAPGFPNTWTYNYLAQTYHKETFYIVYKRRHPKIRKDAGSFFTRSLLTNKVRSEQTNKHTVSILGREEGYTVKYTPLHNIKA